MKSTILFDFDETLAYTYTCTLHFLEKQYPYLREALHAINLPANYLELRNYPCQQAVQNLFSSYKFYEELMPIPELQKLIEDLSSRNYYICAVSDIHSQTSTARRLKYDWVKKNYGISIISLPQRLIEIPSCSLFVGTMLRPSGDSRHQIIWTRPWNRGRNLNFTSERATSLSELIKLIKNNCY